MWTPRHFTGYECRPDVCVLYSLASSVRITLNIFLLILLMPLQRRGVTFLTYNSSSAFSLFLLCQKLNRNAKNMFQKILLFYERY